MLRTHVFESENVVLTRSRLPRPLARPCIYSFWSPSPSRELLTISFCLRTSHMPTSAFWVVFQLVSLQLHLTRVPVTTCSALGSPGQALGSLCPTAPPERLLGPSCVCRVSLQVLRPGFPGTVPSPPDQKEPLQWFSEGFCAALLFVLVSWLRGALTVEIVSRSNTSRRPLVTELGLGWRQRACWGHPSRAGFPYLLFHKGLLDVPGL